MVVGGVASLFLNEYVRYLLTKNNPDEIIKKVNKKEKHNEETVL